ncbi:endonuclease domain-containing protein [Thiocapsa sp. N5-Cardenillas]|uniref:endonuclease domain-containing protein n=1 Tax=Thiocapsa sp. N5-Cardenillas TaxID=3137397 RepID=UPI0035B2E1D5
MTVIDRTKSNKYLKEYRECRVDTCSNRVFNGGHMCSTHRYRFKTYGCYDLPTHTGEPSKLIVEIAPEWAVGKCNIHGYLTEEQMYHSSTSKGKYKTKGCRRCALDRNLKKNCGFDGGIDAFEKLAKEQDFKCEICKETKVGVSESKDKHRKLSADHCHKTGKFRGIICQFCNSGLGYFKDSIPALTEAIAYLKKHQQAE